MPQAAQTMLDLASALPLLERAFRAAVAAADPLLVVPPHLPPPPRGRLIVVGAGKAAAAMALAAVPNYRAMGVEPEGLVITRYGHGLGQLDEAGQLGSVQVLEAGHPLPDEAGERATARLLNLVASAGPDDLVLCLISGGGSALLTAPLGVSLAEKRELSRELLASGASIQEMNVVRKHLSAVKGGRLAALAAPARCVTLAISDVPGDDPAAIASGPTVADPSTFAAALAVVEKFAPRATAARTALQAGAAGVADGPSESVKPGDARLVNASFQLVADANASLEAASAVLRGAGVNVRLLNAAAEGDARVLASEHAAVARSLLADHQPGEPAVALLSGGETTVTIATQVAGASGGRNGEYALAFANEMPRGSNYQLLAADSDGIDGSGVGAGALLDSGQLRRVPRAALERALASHDSHGYLSSIGGLLVTGPTRTNVNDVRVVLLGVTP